MWISTDFNKVFFLLLSTRKKIQKKFFENLEFRNKNYIFALLNKTIHYE